MTQRILVAFDESPQARAALHHALSNYSDAKIHVLHVNDPREWSSADGMSGYYSDRAFEETQESAREVLDEAESISNEYGIIIQTSTKTGRAADAIIEYVEEEDIDHVVLGSHGRRGISRFLLGSVAERVARRSPTSVMIIREEDVEH